MSGSEGKSERGVGGEGPESVMREGVSGRDEVYSHGTEVGGQKAVENTTIIVPEQLYVLMKDALH